MSFFQARPQFEDRQIVQYGNQSVTLSGVTIINSTLLDFTGTTTAETSVNISGLDGYLNGTRLSGLKIKPPTLKLSGSTGTTTQNVTGFVLQSLDTDGSVEWAPISGVSWSISACTSPLYVSTIEACPNPTDPLYITAGNVQFGASPSIIADITNTKLGIGTGSPTERLHIKEGDLLVEHNQDDVTKLQVWNLVGGNTGRANISVIVSGDTTEVSGALIGFGINATPTGTFVGSYLPNSFNITTAGGTFSDRLNINIGSRRGTDAQTRFFGGSSDFDSSSLLGIFYTSGLTITDMVNTDTLRVRDGATAGHVLTSDANGVATWQYNSTGFSGNTSGTCINELWVSTISGCSPVTIGSSIQGEGSTASGDNSFAFGWALAPVTASGNYSFVAGGRDNIASGSGSFIGGGSTNTASNGSAVAFGVGNTASGNKSFAQGQSTVASGTESHAQGQSTVASGDGAHSEGFQTIASGDYSHAEGSLTRATGLYSHVEGGGNLASGVASHAEGGWNGKFFQGTSATTWNAHAEGLETLASGVHSHAEGRLTTASGQYSHAEGFKTLANTHTAHSEGHLTIASGFGSHAEGYFTTASGDYSHAGGSGATASGIASFVSSCGSEVTGDRSAILGGLNISGTTNETVYVPNLNVREDYILHSDSVLEISNISNISSDFKGSYTEFDWTGITTNIISNNNPDGSSGILIGEFSDYPSTKNHGFLTYYGSGYTRSGSPATGSDFYRNKFVLKGSDSIDGMVINPINNNNLAKLWWEIDDNSVMMLMGGGATPKGKLGIALNPNGDEEPTANFQIGGTGTTGDFKYIDGNQQTGYVLTSDADGLANWQPSVGFSGNTSGTCITDIHVSNIHSCSPLNINPLDEGNVYFGSTSGITVDITNTRLGVGTNSPQNKLHIKGTGISSYPSISSDSVAIFENNPETTITLLSDNARNSTIEFGDELSVKGRIIYDNLNNQMIFVTSGKTGDNAIIISQDNHVSIGGPLIISDSIIRNTRDLSITIITDHPLTSSDDIIFLTTSSGGDIVLPAASIANNGRVIEIIRVSGTDSIRVGDDTANVNGTATPGITISSTLYSKNTFTCDGSNWFYQTSSP